MSLWRGPHPLVLASRSAARAAVLAAAGVPLDIHPADIDERAVEATFASRGPANAAQGLAHAKALAVSRVMPGRLVLGADQTLALGDQRFDKPADRAAARAQIAALAGERHTLHSAITLMRDGAVLIAHVAEAHLTMRTFDDAFLDAYLDAAGDAVTHSVGGYQLEGLGSHLFVRIEGDHFTILGMPLIPLLDALRRDGMVA